ncbi:MAG: glycosyltransferase [Dysgonamonadaceae bacterium]|jgi:glycosyltransferase involved in cell wall biosynthesis|nr:glycosyltransferase [Dysgonamonadaceae bacterium]
MKIAILSPFYPYRGGIAQFSAMLYTAFESNGRHEVRAFSFSRLYPGFLFPGKTQYVTEADSAIPIVSERILDSMNPFSFRRTTSEIARFQPDVLIIAYWMSFLAPIFACIARSLKRKMKIIALVHNAIPHEPRFFDKPFARRFFLQCHGFVVMSDIVKQDLLSLNPGAQCCVRPHPLYNHFPEKTDHCSAIEALGLDPQKKTLLFFGLIRDYKGLDLLIDAVSSLDDTFQLLIAGESYGSFDKYQAQIDASPAASRIKVINRYIEDSQIPVLFAAADLLVLPYKSATQSGIIPVAYHFEVPILATNVGGLKQTLEIPETGQVCEPNALSIAEHILSIFNTGTAIYIENIRKEKQNLSWDTFADSVVQFTASL